MPATANSLRRPKIVQVTIDLGDGDAVTVEFDRNRITPAWFADSKRRLDDSDPMTSPAALAAVIVGWDVTNDDGTPFPPTAENLAELAMPVLDKVFAAVIDAATPSRAEGNASANTSSSASTASASAPATPLNGQPLSPSPTPLASLSQT